MYADGPTDQAAADSAAVLAGHGPGELSQPTSQADSPPPPQAPTGPPLAPAPAPVAGAPNPDPASVPDVDPAIAEAQDLEAKIRALEAENASLKASNTGTATGVTKPSTYYVVQDGDTLASIAAAKSVDATALQWLNRDTIKNAAAARGFDKVEGDIPLFAGETIELP